MRPAHHALGASIVAFALALLGLVRSAPPRELVSTPRVFAVAMTAGALSLALQACALPDERSGGTGSSRARFRLSKLAATIPFATGLTLVAAFHGVLALRAAPALGVNLELVALSLFLLGFVLFVARAHVRTGLYFACLLPLGILSWFAVVRSPWVALGAATWDGEGASAVCLTLSLLALTYGAVWLRPGAWIGRILIAPTLAGLSARRLLPLALLGPMLMGWLRTLGEVRGVFGLSTGTSLLATSTMLACTALVGLLVRALERLELSREKAAGDLRQALRRSEAALATATTYLEAAPGAMLAVDPEGRVEVMNAEAERLFGYSRDELVGRPVELLLPEERRGQHVGLRASYAANPRRRAMGERSELRGRRKDGAEIEIEVSLSPIATEQGTAILASLRDVSEQKRVQRTLEGLTRRFQLAARVAKVGFWEWNIVTDESTWDDVMCDLYGRARCDGPLPSDVWRSHVVEADAGRLQSAIARALGGGEELVTDFQIRRADGELRNVAVSAFVQRDERGVPLCMLGTNTDITEQRRAEIRLATSERLFRSAMEHAAVGMALLHPDGQWWKVNGVLCDILGYSERELTERTFQDLTFPPDVPLEVAQVERLWRGEISVYHLEKRCVRKDGSLVWVSVSGSVARDEAGGVPYFVIQLQDITSRREDAARLHASVEEKAVLLREIHHRVKNNLQIVTSILRLQAEQADAEQRGVLDECRLRIHTMALLHERLYREEMLSRIHFDEHLRDTASMVLRTYFTPELMVRLELQLEALTLDLDTAFPLGLLANELITNALKHAFVGRTRGTLTVVLHARRGVLTLRVADDGVGFSDDLDLDHGTSLGLRLIRALSRQLGGSLHISRGRAASITFTLQVSTGE